MIDLILQFINNILLINRMVSKYIKKRKLLINGKKRTIYSKKNSRKEYIKSKGRMVNLRNYLKIHKKRGGGKSPKKSPKKSIKQQIKEKADAIRQRIDNGLISLYKNDGTKKSRSRSRSRGRNRRRSGNRSGNRSGSRSGNRSGSNSPPLPSPTDYYAPYYK
jgi:hypothetical protein